MNVLFFLACLVVRHVILFVRPSLLSSCCQMPQAELPKNKIGLPVLPRQVLES